MVQYQLIIDRDIPAKQSPSRSTNALEWGSDKVHFVAGSPVKFMGRLVVHMIVDPVKRFGA